MPSSKSFYKPREDSILLEKYVGKYSKGIVLDMGTGSGIQAMTAAKSKRVKKVIAADIQKSAIGTLKKNIKNKKITFLVSDLFEIFKKNKNLMNKRFDTIIFNPPYLPDELKVKDLTLEGGKKGYEVIEKFLNDVSNHLKPDGAILIIFSSLTKKDKVDEFIKNNLLESKLLEKQRYFFEDLYVYMIKKSALLKTLEENNIKNIAYFAKGKRGFIFTGNCNARKSKISGTNSIGNKKVAIKIKNPESKAILRTDNEIKFLGLLNKKNIGPRLLSYSKDYLIYEFIEGNFIIDYLKNNKEENIKKTIKKIMDQMFIMDKLKINKEEMSHPAKHIIIDKKNNPVLIDFERARFTIKPANVTQFSDFLISKNMSSILGKSNININKKQIINALKKYKKQQDKNNFNKIVKLIEK